MSSIPPGHRTRPGLTAELRDAAVAESGAILGTVNPDGGSHFTRVLVGMDEDRSIVITPTRWLSWSTVRMEPWYDENPPQV